MSYRRPAGNESYWQPHGSAAPSPYQRHPHDNFNQSTNFDVEDLLPYNGVGHRHLPHSTANQGYLYDPPFQGALVEESHGYRRLGETEHPFSQGHGWTQPPTHAQSEKLPEFRPIFSGNDPAGPMQDRRMGTGLPQTEQTYPSHSVLTQQENRRLDQPTSGAPWRAEPQQPSHQDPGPTQEPSPPGIEIAHPASSASEQAEQAEQASKPAQDKSLDSADKNNSDDEPIILHPTMKVPVKRKPNGTYELIGETTTKKKKKANAPPVAPKKPKKLPENVGDGCYCELCDLVCSGPLNLRMHINGAKHKLNEIKVLKGEATIVRKSINKKIRERFASEGPIPSNHNQEETPIIGLDFVTRVVVPHQDENEDLFECSLCDKKDLMANCIYSHVVGRVHRKAYIRKLKPDLADQYSNIANVYDQYGQLQRRQSSDLTALLNNIVKIAAERDGPGEMQIRLCNEKEGDEDGEDAEDYGVRGYNSEPEDFDNLSPEDQSGSTHAGRDGLLPSDRPSLYQPVPSIPRAPYSHLDPQPSDRRPPRDDLPAAPAHPRHQPSNPLPPVTRLLTRGDSPEPPPAPKPPVTRLPPRAPAAPSAALSVTRLSPRLLSSSSSSSSPMMPSDKDVPTPAVTRLPPKLPPASKETTQTAGKTAPADLPALSEEQLRCYCSDVFIAQEYRRRFGDPTKHASAVQPTGSQQNAQTSSISTAKSDGASVEALLKSLSDTMVHNEDDANMAMELTRALTQATLKYRLREKNFSLQRQRREEKK